MKLENDIIEIAPFVTKKGSPAGIRRIEAQKIVESIYDSFKKLAGTTQGRVFSLVEPQDAPGLWITLQEYRTLDRFQRQKFWNFCRARISNVITALKNKMDGGFKYRYFPAANYIGDGKVVVWWKFQKAKSKKAVSGTA